VSEFALSDDFIKAAGLIILQSDASLRETWGIIDRSGLFRRRRVRRHFALVRELATVFLRPVEAKGPDFLKDKCAAENYCREYLPQISLVYINAMRRNPNDPGLMALYEFSRVLGDEIYKHLTQKTANHCMYGDLDADLAAITPKSQTG
jgi:hypothetical protein